MDKITYEELRQEINQEKTINVPNVEKVIEQLLQTDIVDEDFEDLDYAYSPRKKLRELAYLFNNMDLKVYGTADNIHNCAVPYAKENMYDCACIILKRGLEELDAAIDLLADYIRYGICCGKYRECEEFYNCLNEIPKKEWNWRAFSFSLDYLLDKLNRTREKRERSTLKRIVKKLSNEFVIIIGNDQAYFDKAQVLKTFGNDNTETEESVLYAGINSLKVAPRCALRLSDILFERGEYKEAAELLKRCCINAFKPQPDINSGYSFLLSALCKTSHLFDEHSDGNFKESKDTVLDLYKDFNTAIESGLASIYRGTANTAIKIVAAQTEFEYPYTNVNDPYDF